MAPLQFQAKGLTRAASHFLPHEDDEIFKELDYYPGKGMRPRIEKARPYEINWVVASVLLTTPVIAFWTIFTQPLRWETGVWAFTMYLLTGLSITAGYHRAMSHRSYKSHWTLELFFALFGVAAMEGSALWWCRNHRSHHRWTDTPKDPYNVGKGFLWAHIGWMLFHQKAEEVGPSDIADLKRSPILRFQHKYYAPLVLVMGVIFPTVVAGLGWGDWTGGFLWACIVRMVFVHHATFCVNSLAHYLGDNTYSDHQTAVDSIITALVTFGEGYHNFHHEFPQDYRNGIKWYHYDPTKWLINALVYVGLVKDLKYVSDEAINTATLQVKEGRLQNIKAQISYGVLLTDLPPVTRKEFENRCQEHGETLVIIDKKIYDVGPFLDQHPGGRKTLEEYIGRDVTDLFLGVTGDHVHSVSAESFLPRLAVGQIVDELKHD
eukprot:Clim_evm90s207 gene=Clim_evmTU90s207